MSIDIQKSTRLNPGPLPLSVAKTQADRIEAVLANCQRNGIEAMTYMEIREETVRVYGKEGEMWPHAVNARLSALEAAGRVVCDREHTRPCKVTGVAVKVFSVPMVQASVFDIQSEAH